MNEVTFNVEVTMNERWIDEFCSMLHWMQSCGNLGHSSLIGFYSDGDGDFRPDFKIDIDYKRKSGVSREELFKRDDVLRFVPEVLYDAG